MKIKEDLRIVKTKRNIEYTFMRLLRTTSFEKITVKQILQEALVNRGTFYHHYMDKYDLAEQIGIKEIKKGENRLKACLDMRDTADHVSSDPWWTAVAPFSPEEVDRWFLLAAIPMRESTFEKEYSRMVYEHFYDHIKNQGRKKTEVSRRTLAAVQLFMGYFMYYRQSGTCPSFEEYILATRAVLE